MIPLAVARSEHRRFPIFNVGLIVACSVVFVYEVTLPRAALAGLVLTHGLVPAELTSGQDLPPLNPWPIWTSLITSMFLHGGWLHLAGNMLYLWIFGDDIEDALGHLQYLVFYLICGIGASLALMASAPSSPIPGIGASGAIAGVLGASLLLRPTARVTTLFVFGGPAAVLPVPAFLLIGLWFLLQLQSGIASLGAETHQTGGVAYWAHIGGFLTGVFLITAGQLFGGRHGARPAEQVAMHRPPARKSDLLAAASIRRASLGASIPARATLAAHSASGQTQLQPASIGAATALAREPQVSEQESSARTSAGVTGRVLRRAVGRAPRFGIPAHLSWALVIVGFLALQLFSRFAPQGGAQVGPGETAGPRSPGTATAQARTDATAQSGANATATLLARAEATASAVVNSASLVFGPRSGALQHTENDSLVIFRANVAVADFVAEILFSNPYSTSAGNWDYGFLFRNTGQNMQYRMGVTSQRTWLLYLAEGQPPQQALQRGTLTSDQLDTNQGGSNRLRLVAQGNEAVFYLNDRLVTTLDVSAKTAPGDVAASIQMNRGYKVPGRSTTYEDFTIQVIQSATE